jgi:uncharacterized membrane protein YkvA (DUF1232 family)
LEHFIPFFVFVKAVRPLQVFAMTKNLETEKPGKGTKHTIAAQYVDGFVMPLPENKIDHYGHLAQKAGVVASGEVGDRKPGRQPAGNQNSEHDLTVRLLSGDMEHIDAIILAGSAGIGARDLQAMMRERELIEKKFRAMSMGYHELKHQIREIMRTLEAAALVNATDPLPRCLAEGIFAAQYLLKEDDLIPDTLPGVGLADDAILVKRVVARHGRELVRSGRDF